MMKILTLIFAVVAMAGCSQKDKETLKMVTNVSFPPYEFMRNDEIVGVDVEICRAVAERLGMDFSVESIEFDAVLPAVISGKADLAAAGITITEERKKNVEFSVPYTTSGIVVVYRKSNPYKMCDQLKGKKIGVQNGTTSEEYVVKTTGQEPMRCRTFAEAIAALKTGECDFAIADIGPAKEILHNEPDLLMSDFLTSEDYAIAVKKGRPELLKAVNETIEELKRDSRLSRWFIEFTVDADHATNQ